MHVVETARFGAICNMYEWNTYCAVLSKGQILMVVEILEYSLICGHGWKHPLENIHLARVQCLRSM